MVKVNLNELSETERHGMKKFDFRYLIIAVTIGLLGFWAYHLIVTRTPQVVEPRFEGTPTELVRETNTIRALHDLMPLKENPTLNLVASDKCQDMVKRNYFEHVDPDGKEVYEIFKARGLEYKIAGENLAYNYNKTLTVIGEWYKSPTHRKNLVEPQFTEVGHAICLDKNYFKIVQVFRG